jgi:hypothetical protein
MRSAGDRLLKLGIQAQTLAALSILKLVEVAWADGALDAKERRTVLEQAAATGITSGSPAYGLLKAWLDPSQQLLDAWRDFVRAIREQIGPPEAERLKAEIVERARGRWPAPAAGCSVAMVACVTPVRSQEARS